MPGDDDNDDDSNNDNERQRQEISAFAAMANGDFDFSAAALGNDTGPGDTGTFDFSDSKDTKKNTNTPTTNAHAAADDIQSFGAMARGETAQDADKASFAKAAQQPLNSGTFSKFDSMDASSSLKEGKSRNPLRESNLEAAALALDMDDKPSALNNRQRSVAAANANFPGIGAASSFGTFANNSDKGGSAIKNVKIAHQTPMHTQRVTLPRPLFFGPNLPPRVVKEARQIVRQALAEQRAILQEGSGGGGDNTQKKSTTPRVGQLPPSVRNLVSTMECYGFGIDIVDSEENGDEKKDDDVVYQGSPSVSVYCPRWSGMEDLLPKPGLLQTRSTTENTNLSGTDFGSSQDGSEGEEELNDSFRALARASGFLPEAAESTQEQQQSSSQQGSGQATSSFPFAALDDDDGMVVVNKNSTATTGSVTTVSNTTSFDNSMSERDMFSMFARRGSSDESGSGGGGFPTPKGSITSPAAASVGSSSNRGSNTLEQAMNSSQNSSSNNVNAAPMTDQERFTQWVQQSPANINNPNANSTGTVTFSETAANNSFFQASSNFIGAMLSDDSDDDSVVGSEMIKKVGLNEHLNAALASLEEQNANEDGEAANMGEDNAELTQVPLTEDGGRPLSNQELMDGHAPLFGIDDPPLPSEADLGSHETREEQQKSREQRRIQTIIEKCCPQNVFGPLACPNPATNPDDNHSWNSMSTPLQRHLSNMDSSVHSGRVKSVASMASGKSNGKAPDDASVTTSASGRSKKCLPFQDLVTTKVYDPRTRYGWWNKGVEEESGETKLDPLKVDESKNADETTEETPIQLPPWEHAANTTLVQTHLSPSPEKLHEQNRSLSELHPATSLAQALPFISDRPPSYRFLQVDTQTVTFPALGGEAEPLFCSLAIYHVETVAQTMGDRGMSPIPDLQRCGKVTETLNFDVVNDDAVESRCQASLCPYPLSQETEICTGTRCGIFPLPSNLSVHNLYAIITVSKVISEGTDFEPYLRPNSSTGDRFDIAALRAKAAKAAENHGKFLMPFAFGVAPLLQVFGADIPRIPSSRAVQIPLFRFNAGLGDRQIIDHIMVMLYPKADHRASGVSGPATVTNGGTAMLVMRSFGYLGLHEVVSSKSSLARDRLVDFTGELQLRCRDELTGEESTGSLRSLDAPQTNTQWRSQFLAEATSHGGRSLHHPEIPGSSTSGVPASKAYAQELAPLPLLSAPLGRPKSSLSPMPKARGRGHNSGEDDEPYFHTSFCNEMVCNPRLLHNCPKGNIVVRVEMREMEWNSVYNAFFAHLPSCGPVVHNPRRGSFLVQSAYTTCSARCSDPHFLDEFKLKLPLVLENGGHRPSCVFFTIYRLSFSSRKKWSRRLLNTKRSGRKVDEIAGELVGESGEISTESKDCHLIQLGCGFLPVEKQQALLENGNHDVKIAFIARKPLEEFCQKEGLSPDMFIVSESLDWKPDQCALEDTATEEGGSQGSGRLFPDNASAASFSDRDTVSDSVDDSKMKFSRKWPSILLQVRVSVHSSLHSQNSTLNEFLCQDPDTSVPLKAMGSKMEAFLRLGKEEIVRRLNASLLSSQSEHHQYEVKRLMISTIDIAKSDMCSVSDISTHLLRVARQLWKVSIVGTGNHDLKWANPASILPLRVNAFATLLQILGSSTLFMSKRGVTQLDGNGKWNFMTLGRVLALIFDEEEMFGIHGEEAISEDVAAKLKGSRRGEAKGQNRKKSRRHMRSNVEFFNNGATAGGSEGLSLVSECVTITPTPDGRSASSVCAAGARQVSSVASSPLSMLERRDRLNQEDDTPKMDSLADFRSAMQVGSREGEFDDDIHEGQHTGNAAADSWIKAFGGSSGGASRRWMTAPSPALATIREDGGVEEDEGEESAAEKPIGPLDQLSSEIRPSKTSVRQFRVPKPSKRSSADNSNTQNEILGNDSKGPFPPTGEEINFELAPPTLLCVESPDKEDDAKEKARKRGQTLPATDVDMINAGTSFLDAIEKSLGLSAFPQGGGEEERVFGRHHRKTVSHSSIDWSIPNDDLSNLLQESRREKKTINTTEQIEEFDESMGSMEQEMKSCLILPSFVDRLAALGNSEITHGRWFPFAYEVIIMQWVAILLEQQSLMDPNGDRGHRDLTLEANEALAEASSRTSGAIIACAPVLFEVIKQSLGARVGTMIRRFEGKTRHPLPLVTLDDSMMANLEQLIAILTDTCLDSRNFDGWETLQNCVDVNDSIVCFLRDMFAFLDPTCVYRLTMVYWTRLVARDGRQSQDRDSNIGLRVSWEITKLQMNAISSFVRFQDLIRINSPQMDNWSDWWTTAPALTRVAFFDEIVDRYESLGLPSILSDSSNQDRIEIPRMRPHWLVEIIVDVCLAGIEHAEQNIQRRSSSLLLEMFWSQAQKSLREGYCPVVGSMYITFVEKILSRMNYLATCFSPKSQVRQDLILCVVFVLQSAPLGLLRALWRKLFSRSAGKGNLEKYGGTIPKVSDVNQIARDSGFSGKGLRVAGESKGPDIFDMFGLLNICLATVEYEGCDEHAEADGRNDSDGPIGYWRKGFLLTRGRDTTDAARRRLMSYGKWAKNETEGVGDENDYATTSSRKWVSHDSSIVLIRTAQQIVREFRFVLEPAEGSQALFNPARRKASVDQSHVYRSSVSSTDSSGVLGDETEMKFSYTDTVIFVRGATSVCLASLVLRESDIALVKTLNSAVEIIKIFGIKIFNEAVGETLQHWLRMITFHCGSRRAEVRVPASDFMELILRSTWDCFGSFFRIRIPLLAVQTEVMERIVATAIARHYRDQRKMGQGIDLFSNASAEASLTPLWRTTDRLHHQSASQNVAFRSSLVRLAEKLKKLHRAYIAAHALSFQSRSRNRQYVGGDIDPNAPKNVESETLVRANRISVLRVVNTSAGYSKQFLGLHGASREHATLAHHEAVEDAFLDAADVFSPTELPDHRVAWLRKLAQFHASRNKCAEEATCHYMIYFTLNRSSRLSGSLWSSTPFMPWIDNMSDGIHLEGPAGDPDDGSEFEIPELDYGRQIDKTNSFRRIFYRNENSLRLNAGELEGDSKTPFFGVALTSEYLTTTPWISLKEMEANMLEEAEAAGDLFKKSGVIVSSRYMWSLAARYFAEKYMYGKLAHVYERLARTIVSQVPTIDSTLQQEVSVGIPIGRFYRVWFHGGAPDELIGAEFVYRSATNVTLSKFGKELRDVIRCIIPEKAPIHLVLDGRPEESLQPSGGGYGRMGAAPLEPVRVKVTPLRPVVENATRIRGLPEWFKLYIEAAFSGQQHRRWEGNTRKPTKHETFEGRHRHTRSYSAYHSSSGNLSVHNPSTRNGYSGNDHRHPKLDTASEGELVGADKFIFIQPINKDRARGFRDWLKCTPGNFAEKTLRVTQLQVGQAFPACVSRQTVIHRIVFTQSPLEAAADNMCQWCAVLFRTSIASNGMAVLGINSDPGIGIDAAKVVSECMHTSRIKEMGLFLLRKNTNYEEDDDDVMQSYDRLSDDEIKKYQMNLARSLVVLMELLHLLISRNRDLLLDAIQTRKKAEGGRHSREMPMGSFAPSTRARNTAADVSVPGTLLPSSDRSHHGDRGHRRIGSGTSHASSQDDRSREDSGSKRYSSADDYGSVHSKNKRQQSAATLSEDYSGNTIVSLKDTATERVRTDSAIGIQRELQLAFISLAKDLYPMVHGIMGSDTPRWLKQCCQDNYFSAYTYRGAKIPIGEELVFEDVNISSFGSEDGGFGEPKYSHIMRYGGTTSGERLGLIPSLSRSDRSHSQPSPHTQPPLSPGGSIGSSSAHSRGSDTGRSVRSGISARSMKELKQPIERLASC